MTTLISLDKDVSKISPPNISNESKKNKDGLRKENLVHWKWSHHEKADKSERYKQYNTYIVPNFNSIEEGKQFPRENKRTINSNRMGKRERVIQNNINPFLVNNDYVKDIENQDKFLRGKISDIPQEEHNA